MIRYTPKYKLGYFTDGDTYSSRADLVRMTTIENQLDVALKVTKEGVLKGWEVFQNGDSSSRNIVIKPGIGIVPFILNAIDTETGEDLVDEETGEKIKEVHYIGIRTRGQIEVNGAVGLNRTSVVYVGLSKSVIEKLERIRREDRDSISDVIVDLDEETIITISPSTQSGDFVGETGPYRNLVPNNYQPGQSFQSEVKYPIYKYVIDGNFNSVNETVTVFVNGKPYYDAYSIDGKNIVFSNPLHSTDVVTARIKPKYSLALADIETDNSGIVRIDNSIRVSAYSKSADDIIYKKLLEHIHDNDTDDFNASQILLTTNTGLVSSSETSKYKSYTFQKQKVVGETTYSFEEFFGFSFDDGTYNVEVYINGILCSDPYSVSDNGNSLTIIFDQPLESSDNVQIILYIKKDYTQVDGKLIFTQSHVSEKRPDISLSGEDIGSGLLYPDVVPKLSHEGICEEIAVPSNSPSSSEENVHFSESLDSNYGKEFFPVYKDRTNARLAKFLFSQPKNSSSKQIIHLCASGTFVYNEVPFDEEEKENSSRVGFIMGEEKSKFFDGWKNINFDLLSNVDEFIEFDDPFYLSPVKFFGSPSLNNWDSVFVIGEKSVYALSWSNSSINSSSEIDPSVDEILNLSDNKNPQSSSIYKTSNSSKDISSIVSACNGNGLLNISKTTFILDSNGNVFSYDYVNNKYTWVKLTSSPSWTNASSLFVLSDDNLDNEIFFVGTSDGNLYYNPIGKYNLESNLSRGKTQVNYVDFYPTTVWNEDNPLLETGDNVVFLSGDAFTYKNQVESVSYDESGARIKFKNQMASSFKGVSSSKYSSTMIRDWQLVDQNMEGTPIKAIFEENKLFIVTSSNIYVSNVLFSSANSLNYLKDLTSLSFLKTFSENKSINDCLYSEGYFIVCGDNGVWRGEFDSSSSSITLSESKNSGYVESINNLLYPAYSLTNGDNLSNDGETIFLLGKYGVFQSANNGESWRNVLQLIGKPKNVDFAYSKPSDYLRVIGLDSSRNRIYVSKEYGTYGYGYGYGYGEGLDYFNVISPSFDSFSEGYGIDSFEDNYYYSYGYGYGFEIDTISVNNGDWAFIQDDTGSKYDDLPIKILGYGIENSNLQYIDVEQADGYSINFDQIALNQIIEVYSPIYPLAFINNIPQNSSYTSDNIKDYSVDYYRQSVTFDSEVDNISDFVKVSSEYKTFEILEDFSIRSLSDNDVIIELNGINLNNLWTRVEGEECFSFSDSFNIDDVLKITIRGAHITDIGSLSHEEVEDGLSLEEVGLHYGLDAVRSSNFLNLLMSVQRELTIEEDFEEITGSVSSVGIFDITTEPYFSDLSNTFVSGELSGRTIEIYGTEKTYNLTIYSNSSNSIFLQRVYTYEDFSPDVDGSTTEFSFSKDNPVENSIKVYVDGTITSSWSEIYSGSTISGIEFSSAPASGSNIIVSYIKEDDNIDFSDILYVGQSYKILGVNSSPFYNLSQTFVSLYESGSSSILDLDKSFVENSIAVENSSDIGDIDYSVFYINYNSSNDYVYAGTDEGIWRRKSSSIIYRKSGDLLETINPTGSLSLGDQVTGAYIEYNKDTEIWTVTWGGYPEFSDINLDIDDIYVNDVGFSSNNISFAATNRGLFRGEYDLGSSSFNWILVWDTYNDSRTSDNPEIKKIFIDENHPWTINCILYSGLWRSYDFGNNWNKLTGIRFSSDSVGELEYNDDSDVTAFSYQIDNSDSRSVYYYGQRTLKMKGFDQSSPFISKSLKNFDSETMYGSDVLTSNIVSISNDENRPEEVYIGLEGYGVFKSQRFGDSFDLYSSTSSRKKYSKIGEIKNTWNFENIGVLKTGAFRSEDLFDDSREFSYSVFVDNNNSKTLVQLDIDPTKNRVPNDGELVGNFFSLSSKSEKFLKIIDNFDRGPAQENQFVKGLDGEFYNSRRIELLLDGIFPYDYIEGESFVDTNNNYHWYASEQLGDSKVSLFSNSNGYNGLIKISDLSKRVYALKSDFFNPSYDETCLVIEYDNYSDIPSEYINDGLANHYIGFDKSNIKYKILSSQIMTPDQFYAYGYGYGYGEGNDYFDVLGSGGYLYGYGVDSFETLFSYNYGYGYGYESQITFSGKSRLILRLESDSVSLDKTNDPYYLWHRYFATEMQNSSRIKIFQSLSDEGSFLDATVTVVQSDFFSSGTNQTCAIITYEIGDCPESYKTENSLIYKYIGHSDYNERYIIDSSHYLNSYDLYYDATKEKIIVSLEDYSSSYRDDLSIYSGGLILSISDNSVTLDSSMISVDTNSLSGYSLYFSSRPFITYRILSNTSDKIVLDYSGVDDFNSSDDYVGISYRIEEENTRQVLVDGNDVFSISDKYIYHSSDSGLTWKKLFYGLDMNSSDFPYADFYGIAKDGDYIYAVSKDSSYGGIYCCDITDTLPEWNKISSSSDFSLPQCLSVHNTGSLIYILVGTYGNGLYIGSKTGSNPISGEWTWVACGLPYNNISSVQTINDHDSQYDLDRIWIGTEGSGLYKRDKDEFGEYGSTWFGNVASYDVDADIESDNWIVWKFDRDNSNNISPIVFYSNRYSNTYTQTDSVGLSGTDVFDWIFSGRYDNQIDFKKYLIDNSNIDYVYTNLGLNVTNQSSRVNHKFSNFMTTVLKDNFVENRNETISNDYYRSPYSNNNSLYKVDYIFGFNGESIYEEPFRHFPEFSSITCIKQISDGRIIIGTDRDGVWRSKSDGKRMMMPAVSGDYTNTSDHGYTFNYSSFDSSSSYIIEHTASKLFDGESYGSSYERLFEKYWYYTLQDGVETPYTDIISSIDNASDLIGSYFIVSETVSESDGPSDFKSFVIIDAEEIGSSLKLKLSVGRQREETDTLEETIDSYGTGDAGSRWNEDLSSYDGKKLFIIDFEGYERIDSDLPNLEIKNTKGQYNKSLFIRDIAISGDEVYLACGINGVYYTSDITQDSVSWSKETGFPTGKDATSISFSGTDILSGTWGDGVYKKSLGSWSSMNTGLDHFYIWVIFITSTGDIYIGTEHGGIYKWDSVGSTWNRETNNVVRSQIFSWKTTSVPYLLSNSSFDYSDNEKLISYSWGGGIMVSSDRGSTWSQFNSGLKNYYVQDISISSNSSQSKVAYAATCGGGLFKSTDPFNSLSWSLCSTEGLPNSLNIDEVEVGTDPDIVYIKCRINDFSKKDIPYRMRGMSLGKFIRNSDDIYGIDSDTFSSTFFSLADFPFGQLNNGRYEALDQYRYGIRKHVIYRSNDGGSTWENVYDIEENIDSSKFKYASIAENMIYGMKIVPGEDDKIKFLNHYRTKIPIVKSYVKKIAFTTLDYSSGSLSISEKEFPSKFRVEEDYPGFNFGNSLSEASISIDPYNTDKVFISVLHHDAFKPVSYPIYKSEDNGTSWVRCLSHVNEDWNVSGFPNEVQISTRNTQIQSEEITLSSDTEDLEINGYINHVYDTKFLPFNFYWKSSNIEAQMDYKKFVNIDFNCTEDGKSLEYKQNLIMIDTDGEEGTNLIKGLRPIYLNGAYLYPDIENKPGYVYQINSGNHSEYINKRTVDTSEFQEMSFKINSEYDASYVPTSVSNREISNLCKISNLTSIKLLWNDTNISSNSILRQENSLVGCNVLFDGDSISYPIAFHRVYTENSIKYIEIILVGSVSKSKNEKFNVITDRPIYSNINNIVMCSVNNGISWKDVDTGDQFGSYNSEIIGIKEIPLNFSSSGTDRLYCLLMSYSGQYKLYTGKVNDNRYNNGVREKTLFSEISLSSNIDSPISGGLEFIQIGSSGYIYITAKNGIFRIRFINGSVSGSWETVISKYNIKTPLTYSSANSQRMAFVDGNNIVLTKDAFSNYSETDLSSKFGEDFEVKQILLSNDPSRQDDVFMSINNLFSSIYGESTVSGVVSQLNQNYIITGNTNGLVNNSEKWIGKKCSFRNSDNSLVGYDSVIEFISKNQIEFSETLYSNLSSIYYNPLSDKTSFYGILTEEFTGDISNYLGNVYAVYNEDEIIISGKIDSIYFDSDDQSLEVSIDGDVRNSISNKGFDMVSSFPSFRIGKLTDSIGSSFSGNVFSSRPSDMSYINGLWFSDDFGEGWENLKIFENKDGSFTGCNKVLVQDNDSIVPVFSDENGSRLFINDNWLCSRNIKDVTSDSDGNFYFVTDNGLSKSYIDPENPNDISFDNNFFNDLKTIFLDGNKIYLVGENNKIYQIFNDLGDFNGNEELEPISLNISGNINKIYKDSRSYLWFATEDDGVFAIVDSQIIRFNSGNSGISSNSVKDIIEDSTGKIWMCLGDSGVDSLIFNINEDGLPDNIEWDSYSEDRGLFGSSVSIKEKNGINYVSDGTSTTQKVSLTWSNNSTLKPNSLIIRSKQDGYTNILSGTSYNNPVFGGIFSIESSTISVDGSNVDSWKLTISNFTTSSAESISENSLSGRYCLVNSRESDVSREILANDLDAIYIEKNSSSETAPTESGKNIIIVDKISDNTYPIYAGNGTNINFSYNDFEVVNNSTYYYSLYFYDSDFDGYVPVDIEQVSLSSSQKLSAYSTKVVCLTDYGLFEYSFDSEGQFENTFVLGDSENVRDLHLDNNGSFWISYDNVLLNVSGGSQESYDVNSLFADNIDNLPDGYSLEVKKVVDGNNGSKIVITNQGISVIYLDEIFSYVSNDYRSSYKNSSGFITNKWRPVFREDSSYSESIKHANSNTLGTEYLLLNDSIIKTINYGSNWSKIIGGTDSSKFFVDFSDLSGDITDYVLVGDNFISSTSNGSIDGDFDILSNKENVPLIYNENIYGSISHIYLSENDPSNFENDIIFAGIFNNSVKEEEREIAKIELDVELNPYKSSVTFVEAENGLSIQSVYCFAESDDGNLYAGCKDNILEYKDRGGSSYWAPIEFLETNESSKSDQFVYTSLILRKDSSSIESEDILYATRSSLYGKNTHEVIGLRYNESDISNRFKEIDLRYSMLSGRYWSNGSVIKWVDESGFASYNPQAAFTDSVGRHLGCSLFLNNYNCLLFGGFNNKLIMVPFTSDRLDKSNISSVCLASGRSNYNENNYFPISDQREVWNSYYRTNNSNKPGYLDNRFKPKSSFMVDFVEDSSDKEIGFVSMFYPGRNESPIFKYLYNSTEDITYLSRTNDGGMTWQQISNDNIPDSLFVESEILDNDVFFASFSGRDLENIGLFKSSDFGTNINKESNDYEDYEYSFEYPVSELEIEDSYLKIGTSGRGIFKFDGTDYSLDNSRFTTRYGIGYGRWYVNSIFEDPTNKNRVLVSTKNRGVIEGKYESRDSGATYKWSWINSNDGIPEGEISKSIVMSSNPNRIITGVKDDGLYIKDILTNVYSKVTSGIPSSGTVVDILENKFVSTLQNSIGIENQGDNIIILRSSYETPREDPTDETEYSLRETVYNAEVIYIGTDNLTDNVFVDDDVNLKAGIPYYYRIYEYDNNYNYTERDSYTSTSSSMDTLQLTISGTNFSGKDYSGRILTLNLLTYRPLNFEIDYNDNSNLYLKADSYRVINKGNADIFDKDELTFRIESTVVSSPKVVRPLFMVYKSTSVGSKGIIYKSLDNAETWVAVNTDIPDSVDILSVSISDFSANNQSVQYSMYIATDLGIYKSDNGAVSWTKISNGTNGLPDMVSYQKVFSDEQNSNNIYAVRTNGKIYRSIDRGTSWEEIYSGSRTYNNIDFVSDYSNSIFAGMDVLGIEEFKDPIREEFNVQIDVEGKITYFDLEDFEIGDSVYTDSNSIVAKTLVKNDIASRNLEKIMFSVDDSSKYVKFNISNKSGFLDVEDIKIGEVLENPSVNPFFIQNPGYDNGYVRINKIGSLSTSEDFAISNRGVHLSSNDGQTWNKIDSSLIPSNVFDLKVMENNEIALGTNNGFWMSYDSRESYRNIESAGLEIPVIWESSENGSRRLFRAGENGLNITIYTPVTRSVITYSGDISNISQIKFSWGDLFNNNDGGFSDATINELSVPDIVSPGQGIAPVTYDSWDAALIVRSGPFSSFENAQNYAIAKKMFNPARFVVYPDNLSNTFSFGVSPVFESDYSSLTGLDTHYLEEYRDINIEGGGSLGLPYNESVPPRERQFFRDGNIIVGILPNIDKANFPNGENYPTTDAPIIDRVDSPPNRNSGVGNNFADISSYTSSEISDYQSGRIVLGPRLLSEKYYIYRAYPYRFIPVTFIFDENGNHPTFPKYIPIYGDEVETFSYMIGISKFENSKILCGVSTFGNNWMIGTDSGLFYSTKDGRDVLKSTNISSNLNGYSITNISYTSSKTVFVVAVNSLNDIRFAKNNSDLASSSFDSNWNYMTEFSNFLARIGVNRIFNIEEINGEIHASTNVGVISFSESGTNYQYIGRVGNLEPVRNGNVLGQEFKID